MGYWSLRTSQSYYSEEENALSLQVEQGIKSIDKQIDLGEFQAASYMIKDLIKTTLANYDLSKPDTPFIESIVKKFTKYFNPNEPVDLNKRTFHLMAFIMNDWDQKHSIAQRIDDNNIYKDVYRYSLKCKQEGRYQEAFHGFSVVLEDLNFKFKAQALAYLGDLIVSKEHARKRELHFLLHNSKIPNSVA